MPKATRSFFEEMHPALNRFKSWVLTFRGCITLVFLIGLILYPLIFQSIYWTSVLIFAMILAIYAASWDFLAGIAGQVSFGHALFFGIAGYCTAALVKYIGFHWFASLLFGALVSVILSLIIGMLCLRLKGPYFALGTLAFSLIIYRVFRMEFLGGNEGISGLPTISSELNVIFFIILGFMLISFVILHVTTDSKLGTIFKSIRDDEICAEASGINITKYKIIACMISGFFAGLAGALFTLYNTSVNPAFFQPLYSFYAIVMVAIGGIATISGAIIGSFLFMILSELLRPLGDFSLFIFALVLILIVRYAEKGIMNPFIDNLREFWDHIRRR